jgi:hypothetical protein
VILTLARKKKMTDGDQTMNPPLQEVCLPISIPTYVVWLMKMIAEEERSFMQLYARLSQEDKAVMLKLLERAREQSKARQRLENVLSMKMLHFDELTKEHEELK